MPRRKPKAAQPTWTPNQVVAGNLVRLRQRRGLTQAEVAQLLSSVAGKDWTEAMVAHAERSVTGNRVREFTADDLVTLARAFDVPVLYFLTPSPTGIFVHVPGSRIDTMTMLEAVLGRLDNLSEWESILDEWSFTADEGLPFPLSQQGREKLRAVAGEIALIRAHHLIRKRFKGSLEQLQDTLRSLAAWYSTSRNTRSSPTSTKTNTSAASKPCEPTSPKATESPTPTKSSSRRASPNGSRLSRNRPKAEGSRNAPSQTTGPSFEVLQRSATMLTMASVDEFSFSDLLQQPTLVASAVEKRGRIVLHRRNAPDLVLSRASDLSELAGFARLLAQMVKHVPAGDLANTVGEALPWTSYLSEEGRKEFVTELPAVIQDCEDLGTFAPLETFIASWRSTAAVMADPELSDRLSRPVTKPLGRRVPAP